MSDAKLLFPTTTTVFYKFTLLCALVCILQLHMLFSQKNKPNSVLYYNKPTNNVDNLKMKYFLGIYIIFSCSIYFLSLLLSNIL